MVNFKAFTYNINNERIILFECDVISKTIYNIKKDIGNCYRTDFLHALCGKFSVEAFNKDYTTTTIKIDSNDWLENVKAYGDFLQKHLPNVFVEMKIT